MTELLLAVALGAGALPNFPIDTGGRITTVAGGGNDSSGGTGPALNAKLAFDLPTGMTVDGRGNLYFAEDGNRIRRVTAA